MNSYLLLFCLKNAQLKVVQSIILLKSISPLFWATNLHWRNLKWKLFNDIEAKSCYCQRHDRGFPLYIVVRHIGPTNVEFKGSSSTRVHSGRLLLFVCLFVFVFFFGYLGKSQPCMKMPSLKRCILNSLLALWHVSTWHLLSKRVRESRVFSSLPKKWSPIGARRARYTGWDGPFPYIKFDMTVVARRIEILRSTCFTEPVIEPFPEGNCLIQI